MRALRHLLATVAVLAGLVLAGPAIVSVWVHHDLLDTPRFTSTVEPLAADPAVQLAVARTATRAIDAYLGGPAPDEPGSPAPAVNTAAEQLLTGGQFPAVWSSVTATTHRQLVTRLRAGDRPGAVTLQLAPVLDAIPGLGAATLASPGALAAIPGSVTVGLGPSARTAADTVARADRASGWLPWLAGGLLALAVAVSPWWRVALVVAGTGTAGVAAGVWAGAGAGRDAAAGRLLAGGDGPLVRSVAGAVTGPLRDRAVDVGTVALAVAVAAALWALLARAVRSRRDRTRGRSGGARSEGARSESARPECARSEWARPEGARSEWARSADRPTAG